MNAQPSPKEWELLSSLLDDQLSGAEKRQVTQLLAQRPELGQGLEELRRTRLLLRAAPRRRAPRNFTLTPAMVGKTRRAFSWGWAPSFGLASVLATLLLVLSFVFQASFTLAPAALPAPSAERQSALASAATPLVITWGENGPAQGMAGGMGGGPVSDSAAQPTTAANFAAPAVAATVPVQAEPTEAASISTEASPAATPAPGLVSKAAAPPTNQPTEAPAQPESSPGPILGIPAAEERGKLLDSSQEPVRAVEGYAPELGIRWLWVQVGLGAAAVAFGLAALLLWRRSRH